jgi:putative inorganic carbon (HCO3(-)) transporter
MTPIECSPQLPLLRGGALTSVRLREHILYGLAFGSAATVLLSIAVSQILLGAGILALVVFRRRLRFPPILLPLSLFFVATLIADLLSGDPWRGAAQIRKFFVFGIVLLLFNTFRSVRQVRSLTLVWSGGAAISGVFALVQFVRRWSDAVRLHADLYDYVLDGRITGFMSHWMTFGGEQMIVLLMTVSFLLFAERSKWKLFAGACAIVIWLAILLGLTRSIFLAGVPVGVVSLFWSCKRWFVLAMPVLAIVMFALMPANLQNRVFSVFRPHGDTDSNSRRVIMLRTGWRMIKAHPWFGVGPEQVQPQFLRYVPADVPRPLPKGWYGHLHNVYLQYAAERGIPALACMLWMLAKMAADFLRAIKAHPKAIPERYVWSGALAVIAAVLAEGLFEYNLGDSEVLTMFLAAMTCGYAVIAGLPGRPAHETSAA